MPEHSDEIAPLLWVGLNALVSCLEVDMETNTVMMPRSLTAENGAKKLFIGEFAEYEMIECPECLEHGPDDDCEMCSGNHQVQLTVPVSWTTIKAIYAKAVDHFGS